MAKNVVRMLISVFDRIENIVSKGENDGYQHFLLFLQCFHKDFLPFNSLQNNKILDVTKLKALAEDKKN